MKVPYLDLKHEYVQGRLRACFGREQEASRLMRIVRRGQQHHALVVGQSGSGKTSLLYAFAAQAAIEPAFTGISLVQISGQSLATKPVSNQPSQAQYYQEAFATLRNCVALLDDFGQLLASSATDIWQKTVLRVIEGVRSSAVVTCTPQEYDWLENHASPFLKNFETVRLQPLPDDVLETIIEREVTRLCKFPPNPEIIKKLITHVKKFPVLGNLPKAAIVLADEALTASKLRVQAPHPHPLARYLGPTTGAVLSGEAIDTIVSEKTGVPATKLSGEDKQHLRDLQTHLRDNIIGQPHALGVISSVLVRARLGLRSSNRPLGSFLLLGPSGVGKTETGKVLSTYLYGGSDSFLRLDMSEFAEAHAAQRLTGPPPGYVGSEDGGQLTNHFKKHPYSLLLLDEIEKAHPKVFDMFLQLLDDGRLTSGRGETVDFTQSVIIATSNIGLEEIVAAYEDGLDAQNPDFVSSHLFPLLARHFRMEFLNRFDAILAYKPLDLEELTDIAEREVKKIEQRVHEHHIRFSFERNSLRRHIQALGSDPRLGARPVKRFIETTCETAISNKLLNTNA